MEIREHLARLITIADRCDPDARGYGLGERMPKDYQYPLWEARLAQVDAILAEYDVVKKT